MRHPMARTSDPVSSHMAADQMETSGAQMIQAHRVLQALEQNPGCTSRELAEHCPLDRYVIARRLPELEDAVLVRRKPMRVCSVSKKMATTWDVV